MFVDIIVLLYMIYNKNIIKVKKEKNDWWGEGGYLLYFRYYMLILF